MATKMDSPAPDDAVSWWRTSFQRDWEAFARANGRKPESLLELSVWLSPIPLRADKKQR